MFSGAFTIAFTLCFPPRRQNPCDEARRMGGANRLHQPINRQAQPAPERRTITRGEFERADAEFHAVMYETIPEKLRRIAAAWRLTVEDA